MGKKTIRINEATLRKIIKEAISEFNKNVSIYDSIIEDYEAEEIAENLGMDVNDAALYWFENVVHEGEWNDNPMPKYAEFISHSNEGFDLYRDYGAGYYFAVNSNNVNESVNELAPQTYRNAGLKRLAQSSDLHQDAYISQAKENPEWSWQMSHDTGNKYTNSQNLEKRGIALTLHARDKGMPTLAYDPFLPNWDDPKERSMYTKTQPLSKATKRTLPHPESYDETAQVTESVIRKLRKLL